MYIKSHYVPDESILYCKTQTYLTLRQKAAPQVHKVQTNKEKGILSVAAVARAALSIMEGQQRHTTVAHINSIQI